MVRAVKTATIQTAHPARYLRTLSRYPQPEHKRRPNRHVLRGLCLLIGLLFLCMVLLSAFPGDPLAQQQAEQSSKALAQELRYARSIGIPDAYLQPILRRQRVLDNTHAPLAFFTNTQAVTTYYTNLQQSYQLLLIQLHGIEEQAPQRLSYQANRDLQALSSLLNQREAQGFLETERFKEVLSQYRLQLEQARLPGDFVQVSASMHDTMQALQLLGPVHDQLNRLQTTITLLAQVGVKVDTLKTYEQSDKANLLSAQTASDFTRLLQQLQNHVRLGNELTAQHIQAIGQVKLQQLAEDLERLQSYHVDISVYRKRLEANREAFKRASSPAEYQQVAQQIEQDSAALRLPLLRGEATYRLNILRDEVQRWGQTHRYQNAFDNTTYSYGYEYNDTHGLLAELRASVQRAKNADDYQVIIDLLKNAREHFHAMQNNASSKEPWNQVHSTDLHLIRFYHQEQGQVIVVSLLEQTMRVYQEGKLLRAFRVTTGQYERPTPPGYWPIFLRQSPTRFTSPEPPGSAFWYPDTRITYALGFREGGYFIHDSWWRTEYGPGTNFPHADAGGEFASNGSHGCINLAEADAGWLYQHTAYGTPLLIY